MNIDRNKFAYLRDYIFPICEMEASQKDESLRPIHFLGTGFSIGTEGFFLSASHVIDEESLISTQRRGNLLAALRTIDKNGKRVWQTLKIHQVESHCAKDLVIGMLESPCPSFFSINNSNAHGWEELLAYGYPDSLKKDDNQIFQFRPIFLKGYVTCRLEAKNLPTSRLNWQDSYELNFSIPLGVSGSPVFRPDGHNSLLGIAVGAIEQKIDLYSHEEVEADGTKFREVTSKVQQYGVALRITDVLDWIPTISKGMSLRKLF